MGIKKTLAMLGLAAGATMGSMHAEAKPHSGHGREAARIEHRVHQAEKKAFIGGVIGGFVAGLFGQSQQQVVVAPPPPPPPPPPKVVQKTVVVKETVVVPASRPWWHWGR